MRPKRNAGRIKTVGGALCLDFVNTVHCYGCSDRGEYLNDYPDLVAWSTRVGTITEDEAESLTSRAARHPSEAESAHRRAIELRDVIYRIFTITLEGRSFEQEDLAVLNDYLVGAMQRSRIVKTEHGYYWDMTADKTNLDWILSPVVRSAADLLVSEKFRRIKKCADPVCGWLFLDISRNRSRRWCDMRDCGNRAKASRFYKKHKGAKSAAPAAKATSDQSRPESKIERHLL